MKQLATLMILAVFTGGVSCITPQLGKSSLQRKMSLDTVEKLSVGNTSQRRIVSLFGVPNRKINLEKLPDTDETGEIWEYNDGGYTRLSFFFEKGSKIIHSMIWNVRDKDPEQKLENALRRYPHSKWNVTVGVEWINPHAFPDECVFQDEKQGISVEFRRTRREVSSISWWDASRVPASSRGGDKPPKFCVGSSCSNGIAVEVWLKEWKHTLCKVP